MVPPIHNSDITRVQTKLEESLKYLTSNDEHLYELFNMIFVKMDEVLNAVNTEMKATNTSVSKIKGAIALFAVLGGLTIGTISTLTAYIVVDLGKRVASLEEWTRIQGSRDAKQNIPPR